MSYYDTATFYAVYGDPTDTEGRQFQHLYNWDRYGNSIVPLEEVVSRVLGAVAKGAELVVYADVDEVTFHTKHATVADIEPIYSGAFFARPFERDQ